MKFISFLFSSFFFSCVFLLAGFSLFNFFFVLLLKYSFFFVFVFALKKCWALVCTPHVTAKIVVFIVFHYICGREMLIRLSWHSHLRLDI